MTDYHDPCRHVRRDCHSPSLPDRRKVITALASSAVLGVAPALAANEATADDLRFMRLALEKTV
jgi:hypothetical protein